MELRVISSSEDELELEIAGEDHTFLNVLKRTLLDTPGVAAATYDMNPEQSGGQVDPVLTINTDGSVEPLDTLEAACQTIQESSSAFWTAYTAA